jgi:RHS repeat-associated protein
MTRLTTRTGRAGGALALVLGLGLGGPGPAAAQPPAALVEYYHLDALGSVRLVTDQSGQIVRRHDYLPFGEEWLPPATPSDPLRFTGKPRDAETALDYFGARYYTPRTGRFTTVDPALDTRKPLVDPQLWNRYTYVGNKPFRYVDPDGKEPITVGLVLWGIYEIGSTIYDAYTAYRTLNDPNASAAERSITTGGLLAGIVLPGGGYGSTGRAIVRRGAKIADAGDTGFHSFSAFKRAFGPAGENMDWHHIVEQTAGNVSQFGPEAIHDAKNLIRVPTEVHRRISAYYSSKQPFTRGLTVREWLRRQSLDEQFRFGVELLRQQGFLR